MKVRFKEVRIMESNIDLEDIFEFFNITQEQWDAHSPAKQEELLNIYYEDCICDILENPDSLDYKVEIIER